MASTHRSRASSPGVGISVAMLAMACGGRLDDGNDNAGGTTSTAGGTTAVQGGSSAVGGSIATGGQPTYRTGTAGATGGRTGTGGTSWATTNKGTGGATGGRTGTGGTTATGGTKGVGGSRTSTGGSNGTGGIIATGGTRAVGGSSAAGASSFVQCQGCLELFVPLASEKTGTEFEVDYGTSTTLNLTTTVITAHVYVQTAGNAGGLRLYAKNDDVTNWASKYSNWQNLTSLDEGWNDISLDLSAVAEAPYPNPDNVFDKSAVRWIGFNIAAGDTFTGAVFDDVIVYVDWITFTPPGSGTTDDFTFTTTPEGFTINKDNTPVVGSSVSRYSF